MPPHAAQITSHLHSSSRTDVAIPTTISQKMEETPFGDNYIEVEKTERFDAEVMKVLLKGLHPSLLDEPSEELLKHYNHVLKRYFLTKEDASHHKVRYLMSAKTEATMVGFPYGRVYAENSVGLQSLPRAIRGALARKYYYDVDMEAAHFYLAIKLMRDAGLQHTHMLDYIQNRKDRLMSLQRDFNLTRDEAKTLYTAILFTGRVKATEPASAHLAPLAAEIHNLMTYIWEAHPWVQVVVAHKHNNPYDWEKRITPWIKDKTQYHADNPLGCALGNFLQTEELKVLLVMDAKLTEMGRNADVLIHDGMLVRKKGRETTLPPSVLTALQEDVFEKTGYTIRLVVKELPALPATAIPNAPEIPDVPIPSAEVAAHQFMEVFSPFICRDGAIYYTYNDKTGAWNVSTDLTEDVHRAITHRRMADPTFLRLRVPKEDAEFVDYGSSSSRIRDVASFVKVLVKERKLDFEGSHGKLLFTDGILDLKTGAFHEGFDPSIVFMRSTGWAWENAEGSASLVEDVRRVLFVEPYIYEDATAAGDYLLKAIACGLAGDYKRQKMYFTIAETGTAKTTLTSVMKKVFGSFVGDWFIDDIMSSTMAGGRGADRPRKLYWLSTLEGVRLAFSNEATAGSDGNRKLTLDGVLLKSITGAGDPIATRQIYGAERTIVNRCTLFAFANDIPEISPMDDAVRKRVRYVRPTTSFVANPTEPYQRKADPTLVDRFDEEEIRIALVYLMMNTYQSLTEGVRMCREEIPMPKEVLSQTNEHTTEGSLSALLEDGGFIITNDANDKVSCAQVVKHLEKHKWSKTRVGNEIKKHVKVQGVEQGDRVMFEGTRSRYYFGIKKNRDDPEGFILF